MRLGIIKDHTDLANFLPASGFGPAAFVQGTAVVGVPFGVPGETMHQLEHEQLPRHRFEGEAPKRSAGPKRRLRRHLPIQGDNGLGGGLEVSLDSSAFLWGGQSRIQITPQPIVPGHGLVIGSHRVVGTSIGGHSAPDEPRDVADGI